MLLGVAFYSCSIRKYIPENERLYTGATIEIQSDSVIRGEEYLKEELQGVVSPEPNSKFLGMYLGLYYHYKNQKEKPGFINRWLNDKFGEEPVYQSDVEANQIKDLLLNRLENRGFFYSSATSDFEESEQKASINYTLKVPTPYRMETYQMDSMPAPIHDDIKALVDKSRFRKGIRFDLSFMERERERIDFNLKNKGYYNFDDSFLIFEADTNRYDNKRFDLYLKLKNGVPKKSFIPYKISKINIYPSYEVADSIQTTSERYNEKNYIQKEVYFKPKYLDPFIKIEEGEFYSPDNSRNTARRLSTIGAYKYVNIQYKEIDTLATDSLGLLEANIYLSPLTKRAFRAELQVVTKSNNFSGPGLALTYSNRNVFGGGETYNITTKLGYEAQLGGGQNAGKTSLEIGVKNELIFPRVLFPIKIENEFFEYSIPKTKTSISLDYLNRTKLYTLLSGTALFGYVWDANRYVTHEINPLSINYTELTNTTPEFEQILNDNPFLRRSFEQQFISGLTYGFTYNGMVDADRAHQKYLNFTLDVAGNTISLMDKEETPGAPKTFLGLEYAQYAKADVDIHYHFNFGRRRNKQTIAARLFAGYGLPYGNSDVVPFVKQYFAGGPYSVRAFRIRSLGPGTYNADEDEDNTGNFFDKTGNIRLEANIEYRFPIVSYLKGAIFADAGNIWNSEENPTFDGKDKFTSNFINELGMGAGFGLRVDIQSFVIRFDLAAPFHDPSKREGERFKFDVAKPILNFAIGYPF
ncbi:outer membrane protein assembly factor [Subsaxibacter sp. CAU 1640]|uniref:translocation and assembly module lipoprotein TamL n=1 Tax=Subsaxibacter sp. CAU 1640 TaxID=2933271 RepID=UPI002005C617|nr:BamA/TamA family outer membrane protein [Subsaxibacter sp. CAU 1640]MCK7589005.1 outer membrane protein assembly factor [Subsaxibacter sp. CAU 1640]